MNTKKAVAIFATPLGKASLRLACASTQEELDARWDDLIRIAIDHMVANEPEDATVLGLVCLGPDEGLSRSELQQLLGSESAALPRILEDLTTSSLLLEEEGLFRSPAPEIVLDYLPERMVARCRALLGGGRGRRSRPIS